MNKEERKVYMKKYWLIHSEQNRNTVKKYRKIWLDAWRKWFIKNDLIPPSSIYHYHHILEESKFFAVGNYIGKHPCSPKHIELMKEELEKCVGMTAKEHKQIHAQNTYLKDIYSKMWKKAA